MWSNTTQTGLPTASCPGLCPDSFFNVSKDGDATTSLDNLCQFSVTLTVIKCFWMFRGTLFVFQFVPTASCPVTGHQRKEAGSVLFAPSLHMFIHINKIPTDPSLL